MTNIGRPAEGQNQWYPFMDRPSPSIVDGVMQNPPVVPIHDAAPLPSSARFVVVGAGIHGLSTAYHLAMELERIALEDEYFVEKKLYPNVDFYSGIIYRAMGIPTSMFTVLFAVARTVGWVAQWNEMIEDPTQKIGRPRQLYTGEVERDFVEMKDRT